MRSQPSDSFSELGELRVEFQLLKVGKKATKALSSILATALVSIFISTTAVFAVSSSDLFFNLNASDTGSYNPATPGTWRDLSPYSRNGTIVGSLNYNNSTGALEFPNTGQRSDASGIKYVDMGAGFNNFGNGITIEFEAHFGSSVGDNWERIFDFGNGEAQDNIWVGNYASSDEIAIELWRPNPTTQQAAGRCKTADSVNAIQANTFKKYVITLNGSECNIYINGVQVDTEADGPAANRSLDNFFNNSGTLSSTYPTLPNNVTRQYNYIGRSNWGSDITFNGAIKYVRIYTAAITAQEAANNATTYTLTYSTSGSASGTAPASKTGNGLVTLDGNTGSLTKVGHTFAGWSTSANQSTGTTGSYNLTANTTLYPAFTINTYNVTYDEQGGSSVSDGTFTHGGSLSYPANPTKNGYTFQGWFDASSGGNLKTASAVAAANASTTLYAQWSANTYNVTYDEHGGSSVSDTSYVFGNTFAFPATPTKTGHTFLGWFDAVSGGTSLSVSSVYGRAADSALHAQWNGNTYNVTYDEHGGSTVSDGSYVYGNILSFPPAPTKTGHTFLGWFDTASGGSDLSAATVSARVSNSALHAQWSANTYNVTYDEHGGSTVSDGNYVYGNTLVFPSAPTRSGYNFAGWFAAASGGSALTASAVSAGTSNVTLHAQWTPLPAQTVSWAPTNTSIARNLASITPSSLATTSGDGQISYSVFDARTTGCSVDSSTGVVTFTGVGICSVRATAASTANYLADTHDVDFTITSSTPAVSLALDMTTGSTVANSTVDYAASGLQSNSSWTLVVRSNPQTIASGTFSSSLLSGTAQIPSELSAGWHSITLSGTGANGETISHAVWFEVSNSGTLLQTSGTGPVTPTSSAASLAQTGANTNSLWMGAVLLLTGAAFILLRRSTASKK